MPYGVKEFGLRNPNGYYLAFAEEAMEEEKACQQEGSKENECAN
ncbi:MAG: hypothetical protein ABIU20_03425 [Blastocatellia bacterium]